MHKCYRNAIWTNRFTIAEDSKTKKIQVTLALHWVPSDIRIAFSHEHRTALETTAGEVLNHLERRLDSQILGHCSYCTAG